MKVFVKVMLALGLAAVCAGYAYAEFRDKAEYETVPRHVVVKSGETYWEIANNVYNPANEKECFDEWQTINKDRNKRLFFNADGSVRHLKSGDILCFEVRERIAK